MSLSLLGQLGVARFLIGWLVVLVLLAASFVVGGPALLLSAVLSGLVVHSLLDAGAGSRVVKGCVLAALAVGVSAFGYLWWAWVVGFNAADARQPTPAAAGYGTLAGVVLLLSISCFVAAVIAGIRGTKGR